MDRRDFIKSAGVLSAVSVVRPERIFAAPAQTARHFGLHPFVAAHPEAVFIRATGVQRKTDDSDKRREGQAFARDVFTTAADGMPLSTKIALKPNLTGGSAHPDAMGMMTDAPFVEGVMEAMIELGLPGEQFYLREGNVLGDGYSPNGSFLDYYRPAARRLGARLTLFDSGRHMYQARLANLEEGSEVIWRDVPDGVIFQRMGYVAPVNADDAFNLDIAKFKAHGMGLTLAAKNWQGTCISPYIHFCESLSQLTQGRSEAFVADVNPEFIANVDRLHAQHLEAGVPRWDRPGRTWNSGWGMEGWSQKTLDNLAAGPIGLSVIEGIYGRNGNGFSGGPGPGDRAQDFMSNVLIFGLNPIKVDIVGHWLGGHEPGNFGLFHAALDRGQTDRINPHWIPVYDWTEGVPQLTPLEQFERTPLQTYYLQRDYDGTVFEDYYHMVDEPYDYGVPTAVTDMEDAVPEAFVLGQNYPNPFNASTLIEYRLPTAGRVRVDIHDALGQVVDVLVDDWRPAGAHVASWASGDHASGVYYYRFRTAGFDQARKMTLLR
jgi:hypothetical protein